nr:hypothetical protein [Microbispora rosea]
MKRPRPGRVSFRGRTWSADIQVVVLSDERRGVNSVSESHR